MYVESSTEVAKGELTKDDIRLLSAAVLQIKKIEYKPLDMRVLCGCKIC